MRTRVKLAGLAVFAENPVVAGVGGYGDAGIETLDARVAVATIALLAIVAVVACFVPVRRAIRIQAIDALRHE